jgi:Family of unknown function (DUF6225)
MTDEEEFEHTVQAWTVGDLRSALEGIPDSMPLVAIIAEEPGSNLAGPDQVVTVAGMRGDEAFELDLEFPSGTYYRRTNR